MPGALCIAETGKATGPVERRDLFSRLRRFDPRTGDVDVLIEGGLQTLINPDNIAVDRSGTLYVCEDKGGPMLAQPGDNRVVRVTPDGQTVVFATLRGGREPSGVVFTPYYGTLFLDVLAE